MCGFVGYLPGSNKQNDSEIIEQMMDTIHHRGPDSGGYHVADHAVLGFRRLTIIDLSDAGNQPLFDETGRYTLTFNGEIYNHKDIRAELEAKGYKFKSNTDSEVLVHGYAEWKEGILDKVRGMFAFAIWDEQEQSLFLARDMFGIKPLYYGKASNDGTFFFGSEIKSFLPHPSFVKEVNKNAVLPYLTFQYPVTNETFFKNIYKLEPGTWMRVTKDGHMMRKRYWDFKFDASDEPLEHYLEQITDSLKESVRVHKIADVPVGAFLSGGIDSSFITALFKPENTFSVGFGDYEGIFNETDLARRLSEILGFNHHVRLIGAEDFFGALPTIQYHLDEPQSNLSTVPLYFLAQLASEHVTVVLSGEGADELFGGYESYMRTPHLQKYDKMVPKNVRHGLSKLARKLPNNRATDFLVRGGQTPEEYFIGQARVFPEDEALAVLKPAFRHGVTVKEITAPIYQSVADDDDVTKMMTIDMRLWLPGDILLKADKMSSAHSLELRVPFLDKEVMKVAEKIPTKYRIKDGLSKYALRKAALAELPEEWARRPKNGFPVPIRDWLKQDKYYNYVKEIFQSPEAGIFFDQERLMGYLDEHYQGKAMRQRYIYTAMSLILWYREYFINR
ncbi:MAG: asparagine synthase (glutamine-hydrolyzing) [Peptococcaceae bacterium]|nr:asparagine synthase (glutamine-hydrolyzing) [Peptococcaceae bacterium]